jgi:hypothetical protein
MYKYIHIYVCIHIYICIYIDIYIYIYIYSIPRGWGVPIYHHRGDGVIFLYTPCVPCVYGAGCQSTEAVCPIALGYFWGTYADVLGHQDRSRLPARG